VRLLRTQEVKRWKLQRRENKYRKNKKVGKYYKLARFWK
jgi:hypothetical protein